MRRECLQGGDEAVPLQFLGLRGSGQLCMLCGVGNYLDSIQVVFLFHEGDGALRLQPRHLLLLCFLEDEKPDVYAELCREAAG